MSDTYTRERDAAIKRAFEGEHGCFTGDCPHDHVDGCHKAIAEHFADWAWALAQDAIVTAQGLQDNAEKNLAHAEFGIERLKAELASLKDQLQWSLRKEEQLKAQLFDLIDRNKAKD